jgi:sulfatase modifying factor 1
MATAGCRTVTTPEGAVMLTMSTDPSTDGALVPAPDRLQIAVTTPDGGRTYSAGAWAIPGQIQFPQTLAIDSNGNPRLGVVVTLSVWSGGAPLDLRHYEVSDIPTDRVVPWPVVFSRHCAGFVAVDDAGAPTSTCPAGTTCDPTAYACRSNVVDGAEGGTLFPSDDAADTSGPDGTSSDASPGGNAEDDVGIDAPAFATSCDPACVEGSTHCAAGQCVPAPPSCVGGGLGAGYDCGGANGTDDCCAVQNVPGGSFYRDYDGVDFTDMSHPATVSGFGLDVYEVTVGRFRKFVQSYAGAAAPWAPSVGSGRHDHLPTGGVVSGGNVGVVTESGWSSDWNAYLPTTPDGWTSSLSRVDCGNDAGPSTNTWTPTATSQDSLPANCVNWYQAYAFCIWDGGFLPTATEWDYAASGGSNNQWVYAWGSSLPLNDPQLAVWGCWYGDPVAEINRSDCVGVGNVAPVGTAAQGRGLWGQLDLTGSMLEWTLDYASTIYPLPCSDCANVVFGSSREIRGGAFDTTSYQRLASAFAGASPPDATHGDVGFRCARSPRQ